MGLLFRASFILFRRLVASPAAGAVPTAILVPVQTVKPFVAAGWAYLLEILLNRVRYGSNRVDGLL